MIGKKILVLGTEQNNFLSFLYSKLKSFDSTFTITAPFIKDHDKNVLNESWMYDNNLVTHKSSFFRILQSSFLTLFDKHIYQTFFFILFVEKKLKKSVHFVIKHIQAKAFFITNQNFREFDTFHFHYLQYSYLREVFLIPKGKKIVCTFWGSDLLRTSDIFNFYFVKKVLNKATVITCQSEELKEIILSKFGRNLEAKIKIAIFPVDSKIYEEIDSQRHNIDLITSFKKKYGYSLHKKNVLIGHNGSPFNNHLKIIGALQEIKGKENIQIIINLNYALQSTEKEPYKKELIIALQKTGIEYTILENYFSKEELSISRLATDVFIHMPISDALSGTMLEMLYAESIVITGSWLPYKTFENAGIVYHKVNDFNQLGNQVDAIMTSFDKGKDATKLNKREIEKVFLSQTIVENWAQILI
jgi:hypothetical protein